MIRTLLVTALVTFGLAAQDGPRRGPGGPGAPGDRLEMMAKHLNLTDDQKAQIKPILEEQQTKMQALRDDTSLDREAKMPKMREIMEDTNTKIKPILTEDQQKKLADMRPKGPGRGQWRRHGGNEPPPQNN